MKKVICFLVVLMALVSFFAGRYCYYSMPASNSNGTENFSEEKCEASSSMEKAVLPTPTPEPPQEITFEFGSLSELAVEKYYFTDAGEFSQNLTVRGYNVPLTNKHFTVVYSGYVSAGIEDMSDITYEYDHDSQILYVTIPNVVILTSYIDQDSVQVYDESSNIINQIDVSDVTSFMSGRESIEETNAVSNGLLTRAEDRVETLVRNHIDDLFAGTELEGYSIEVQFASLSNQ